MIGQVEGGRSRPPNPEGNGVDRPHLVTSHYMIRTLSGPLRAPP